MSGSWGGLSVLESKHNLEQSLPKQRRPAHAWQGVCVYVCMYVRVCQTSWGWGSGCSWVGRRQAWLGWGWNSGSTAGTAPGPGTGRAPGRPPGSSDGPTPAARRPQQLLRVKWKMAYYHAAVAKRCNYSNFPGKRTFCLFEAISDVLLSICMF